jgi:hypothetical protein
MHTLDIFIVLKIFDRIFSFLKCLSVKLTLATRVSLIAEGQQNAVRGEVGSKVCLQFVTRLQRLVVDVEILQGLAEAVVGQQYVEYPLDCQLDLIRRVIQRQN